MSGLGQGKDVGKPVNPTIGNAAEPSVSNSMPDEYRDSGDASVHTHTEDGDDACQMMAASIAHNLKKHLTTIVRNALFTVLDHEEEHPPVLCPGCAL